MVFKRLFRRKRKKKDPEKTREKYLAHKGDSVRPPPMYDDKKIDLDYEDVTEVINLALNDLTSEHEACQQKAQNTIRTIESIVPPKEKEA